MNKLYIIIIKSTLIFFVSSVLNASTLFYAGFESDLSEWTGVSAGSHSGVIVNDPLAAPGTNNVLSFTNITAGGDIFTTNTFTSSTSGNFILSFDYLGIGNTDNLGGFIGYSYGYPGSHTWIGGTGSGYPDLLEDSGKWEHVEIAFSAGSDIHIMLEDYSGSNKIAGDVFFDNILLTDANGPDPIVPEPGTMLLLGIGFLGLIIKIKRN